MSRPGTPPKTIPCPTCGVPAGKPCVSILRRITIGGYHVERRLWQ